MSKEMSRKNPEKNPIETPEKNPEKNPGKLPIKTSKFKGLDLTKITTERTYHFTLFNGKEETTSVTLHFVDGVFKDGTFPYSGGFDREEWRIKTEIYLKIVEIEKTFRQTEGRPL